MSVRLASRPQSKPSGAVVALGASAGGLESLGRLLEGMPVTFPAPILVVLHLDPHHRSQVVPLLQHLSPLPIHTARTGVRAKPGNVYVAPPDHHLEVKGGRLRVGHAPRVNYSRPSIDRLFTSVANDCGPAAVVAVLSGTGTDGTAGVRAIKSRGGQAVAEDAATARYPGMPQSAGRTGLLDAVLPIGRIPAFLQRALTRRVTVSKRQWTRVMAALERRTGTRFSRYRSTTLHRRLQYRLAARGCSSMAEYLGLLESDPTEADQLKSAFLIKVSSFLRDPGSWRRLSRMVGRLTPSPTLGLRAWSAGCATGEEAYTIALLLARKLGTGPATRWKVFATDLDDGALVIARAAKYRAEQVRVIPRADLLRYFVPVGGGWRVGKELRDRVVFGRHDLLRDPPLSKMDVLACRNVLMYFTPEEKRRTLHRLSFALNPGGLLMLGRNDAVEPPPGFERVGHTTLFRPGNLQAAMPPPPPGAGTGIDPVSNGGLFGDSSSVVAIAVDAKGKVLLWNRAAAAFFGKTAKQAVGKPLAAAVGKKVAPRLRAAVEDHDTRPVIVERALAAGPRRLQMECLPAALPASALFLGIETKVFAEATPARPARSRPVASRNPRPTEEVRFMALQDLNDELQSRNEELETVNEELQSLNDEMSAMEDQMRGLGEESRRTNDFLRLLLDTSTDVLVACDADNRVAFWNKAAVKRFRLSPVQAVGTELFGLVPALDLAPLRAASRKVRQPGRGGRVSLEVDGVAYLFDSLPSAAGKRRSYLLRMRPV